ncbi:Photosystem I assembly protein Ycf3 [Thalassocella blandensis]|nr:Photosystem I assembly protein Ycf3 [Thalassocella blandensis]
MLAKTMKFTCFMLVAFFVTACVTTGDIGKRKVDKQKALEANVKLGMAYLQQKKRDSALRAFNKALEFDDNSAEAHQGMALVHQLNGETALAESSFKKALRSRADFSRAGIELSYGRFLRQQGRCDEAMKYFESAGKDIAYPNRSDALYHLGLCTQELGDEPRAKAAYEYALNLNNSYAPAALELAHMSFAERDYANAKKYLDVYAANSRQSARSLWLGIRIERIFGNKDKEASYALALKNLHPYSKEYLEYKNLIENRK